MLSARNPQQDKLHNPQITQITRIPSCFARNGRPSLGSCQSLYHMALPQTEQSALEALLLTHQGVLLGALAVFTHWSKRRAFGQRPAAAMPALMYYGGRGSRKSATAGCEQRPRR